MRNRNGESALINLARFEEPDLMRKFLSRGKFEKQLLNIALLRSSEAGHIGMVRALVEYGADVNACGGNASRPLHRALDRHNFHVDESTQDETALYLIAHGANVNARQLDGWTPLRFAIEYQLSPIIHVLKKAGAK